MAPTYKLTYFNVTALAEPIRYLLSYGGVDFEDYRMQRDEWAKVKPTTPFGKVPMLEVDGKKLHQSAAICRYLAKQFGISGKDSWEGMQIDIVVDTIGDFKSQLTGFHYEADATLKAKKKEVALKESLPFYLPKFEEMIKSNGGFFVGGKMTWADLYWVALHEYMKNMIGYEVTRDYPGLKAHKDKMEALPAIKAWIAKRPKAEY